ncbi:MAG: aminotransferase class V-fold PLP-dependent enzyme [Anaerolineaceae bacterium]
MTQSNSYSEFLHKYPNYAQTISLDDLRQHDYSRLDQKGHIYLDYTGAGLYAESQVTRHLQLLNAEVYGNPHSSNPTSLAATEMVENARKAILRFFNAPEEDYVVIFTSNASGALKLVGESYPFTKGGHYLLTFDNHNSVNGIREYALSRGSEVTYIPMLLPEMSIDEQKLQSSLDLAKPGQPNLFAYPAQSNFSGRQHSLNWVDLAHAKGWDVLLDIAAFAPTNPLDLNAFPADFVPISFYKMFGYPTGVGALIARRQSLQKLQRPWFAGGTITVASVQGEKHYMADAPNAFEDGTINFLSIPAVEIGLNHIESIGLKTIHDRVHALTAYLLAEIPNIKHSNGKPVIKIYGPTDSENRGGTIALNFVDANGQVIDHRYVEERANQVHISLRTGCFCNPGAGEIALGISSSELQSCFRRPSHESHLSYDEFRLCIDGKASGAVRISVGLVSNFADVEAFLNFAKSLAG